MMNGFGELGWRMDWWWIIGIMLLIGIIWLVALRINRRNKFSREPGKSVLDILKERYARGEIDKQEFEERKKEIQ
ncbi:MAG: SHOCT domain-containing protein [Paludibacter sp.]|nr:SHOCT domain-containing protein [Paludibacter sp.]